MTMGTRIIADLYRDSVALMQISSTVSQLDGVSQASCIMATPTNLELLHEAGLLSEDPGALLNEVLIAVEADNDDSLARALDAAEAELRAEPVTATPGAEQSEPLRSVEMALDAHVGANLALIATPGPFATAEATKALHLGLNVMMFSDNVPVESWTAHHWDSPMSCGAAISVSSPHREPACSRSPASLTRPDAASRKPSEPVDGTSAHKLAAGRRSVPCAHWPTTRIQVSS
jgi:hypothetical protein